MEESQPPCGDPLRVKRCFGGVVCGGVRPTATISVFNQGDLAFDGVSVSKANPSAWFRLGAESGQTLTNVIGPHLPNYLGKRLRRERTRKSKTR